MQNRSRTLLNQLPGPFASIGLAVVQGGVCSLGAYLIFGVSSAIPICIALAIAVAQQARSVEENSTQHQAGHALEVGMQWHTHLHDFVCHCYRCHDMHSNK
ncbi:TPA: hypothetical protein ACH3X1_013276 [Trebouxia sp. C0004]